jgi:hypothetical protein
MVRSEIHTLANGKCDRDGVFTLNLSEPVPYREGYTPCMRVNAISAPSHDLDLHTAWKIRVTRDDGAVYEEMLEDKTFFDETSIKNYTHIPHLIRNSGDPGGFLRQNTIIHLAKESTGIATYTLAVRRGFARRARERARIRYGADAEDEPPDSWNKAKAEMFMIPSPDLVSYTGYPEEIKLN